MRSPQDLDAAVEREARAVVDQTDVGPPVDHATPRAQQLTETLGLTLASLRTSNALIDQKVTETLAARQPPPAESPGGVPKLFPPLDLPIATRDRLSEPQPPDRAASRRGTPPGPGRP